MNKTIHTQVRDLLIYMLWVIPIPFGAFSTDAPGLVTLSVLLFVLLSFAIPAFLQQRWQKQGRPAERTGIPFFVYGRILGMVLGLSLMNAVMDWSLWQAYIPRLLLYFCWMAAVLIVQYVISLGFSLWYDRRRQFWFSEFVDPVVIVLPFPCAVLGMFLFPAISATGDYGANLFMGLFALLSGFIILTGILSLMTFAFYFYPSRKKYAQWRERWPYFARILIMGGVWLATHFFLFSHGTGTSVIGSVFFQVLPIWQNNILVFITPFLFEAVILIIAVAVGNVCLAIFQHHP